MIPSSAVPPAARLLEAIFDRGLPADRLLAHHFREHPQSGAREREAIAGLVYEVLRHRRRLAAISARSDPEGLATAARETLSAAEEKPHPALETGVAKEGTPAERLSYPDWLWQAMAEDREAGETEALAAALNEGGRVDLRVNTRLGNREEVMARFRKMGIDARATPFAPEGVRLERRVGRLPGDLQGIVEFQDEGSQLLTHLLAPREGELVVDLCAGGGGKSLHAAVLMAGRGRIVATDVDRRRLQELSRRAKKARSGIIEVLPIRHERDPHLLRLAGKVDRVLVDAPCSGTGRLRRNPEIKWQLTPAAVENHLSRQAALLEAAAALVRPGGTLVYATCSILAPENQGSVTRFLAGNRQFRLLAAGDRDPFRGSGEALLNGPYLTPLPHRTGSDGFFGAIMARSSR
ncbi:MAG: RsmB/NOP family class I SAM-dependent RNA methyltransferase [Magnetococcales bacterium]|nr:RsmB/NOP family class I SAM-dependent RNA methyltransferase [Magnetococcales bacterium]